ncbi:putative C-_U-editing enzyme APOBEC-4 [Conger conger]|uniref:putative C->U-editing enzyme APOBEC-4 n=1 Tax=Conger conger TaxID=82655 RepID=UPI002A59C923|nr:putative C->U-editing enzyme APOBEC-4 [Conger conger]
MLISQSSKMLISQSSKMLISQSSERLISQSTVMLISQSSKMLISQSSEMLISQSSEMLISQSKAARMWGRVWDPPACSECPHHVRTGADAPVSFPEFCEAFGFPAGPSGAPGLLLFYELRGPNGGLLQRGRATGCPRLGLHPETLLFGPEGYLQTALEEGEEVSYIMLYSNYTPCEEAPAYCASALCHFLELHPGVRLDLLFSQLYRTDARWPDAAQNRAGLRRLAALWPRLSLSPLSGGAWAQLQRAFVRGSSPYAAPPAPAPGRAAADHLNAVLIHALTGVGPAFLDLPLPLPRQGVSEPGPAHATPAVRRSLTLLPPPHLHPYLSEGVAYSSPFVDRPVPHPLAKPLPLSPHYRPINVVRHVRMPPPGPGRPESSRSSSSSSSSSLLLPPGRAVEVLKVTERALPSDSQSQRRASRKGRSHTR